MTIFYRMFLKWFIVFLLTLIIGVALGQQHESVFLTREVSKGIFYTYKQFLTNSPEVVNDFTFLPMDDTYTYVVNQTTGLYPNKMVNTDSAKLMYMLYTQKGKKIKNAYAFSDGEHIYLNSALYQNHSNYYLKVLDFGRILYTRDPVMEKVTGPGVGFMFGAVGGLAVGITRALTSNKDSRGVIVFYEDEGVPFILNKKTVTSLLLNYDNELYQQYLAERDPGDEAVLEKYVLLFNQKHP